MINLQRLKPVWMIVLVCILAITAYVNVLDGSFLWDDEVMVVGNGLIRSLDNVGAILTTSPFGARLDGADFYRPLQTLSYTVDYAIWGLNPLGFHITNLILHVATVGLLALVLLKWGYSLWGTGLVAALVAVHPINIESVSYISGRGDALYLLLCVSVIYLFQHTTIRRWWWGVLALFLYVAALITKENAVPLGVMMAFLAMVPVFGPLNMMQRIVAIILGVSSISYAGLRAFFLAEDGNSVLSLIASADLITRIQTIPYCIVTYFKLFVFPYPLHMEYHYVETTWANPYLWIGIPLIVAVISLLLYYSQERRKTIFWMLWIGICLGPVLQLVPLASTVREHWASMAQLGFWISVISVLDRQTRYRQAILAGILVLIGTYWSVTVIRNLDWREPLRLYQHDVIFEPKSFLLHNNVGVELFRKGDIEGAQKAFELSIETSPNLPLGYGTALNNLGAIYEGKQDLAKAESLYRKSIESSSYELAYSNLARTQLNQGNSSGALDTIRQGLNLYPYNSTLKVFHVAALFFSNQPDAAEAQARELLTMYPETADQVNGIRNQYYMNQSLSTGE